MPETYYCTAANVENLYSEAGVDLAVDDLTGAYETSAIERAMGQAKDLIAQYALQRYTTEQLAQSNWVIRRATLISCYFLSMRRGNPPPIAWQLAYDEIKLELQSLIQGKILIPDALPFDENIPVVSTQVIDPRYRYTPLRNDPYHTTNDYAGRRDMMDYGEW